MQAIAALSRLGKPLQGLLQTGRLALVPMELSPKGSFLMIIGIRSSGALPQDPD